MFALITTWFFSLLFIWKFFWQTLVLSYAYHCCAFLPLVTMTSTPKTPPLQEAVLFPTDNEFDMSLWNSSQTDIWPQLRKFSTALVNYIVCVQCSFNVILIVIKLACSTNKRFPSIWNKIHFSIDNNNIGQLWLQNFADNLSKKFGSQINELWDSFGQDFTYPGNLPAYVEEYFEEETQPTKAFNRDITAGSVQCLPLPGTYIHTCTQTR